MGHFISQENLVVALEKNFYSYVAYTFKRNENTSVLHFHDVTLISSGWVGQAQLSHDQELVTPVIAIVKKYFHAIGRSSFSWWVTPNSKPDNLSALLQACDFHLKREDIGMILNLQEYHMPPIFSHEDFSIEIVDSITFLNDYVQVYAQYWKNLNMDIQRTYMRARDILLQPEYPIQLYTGYYKGEPVTTCEVFLQHGVAGFYAVTTSKKMRNQGFASHLLSVLLQYAAGQGYEVAALLSTPLGRNVYRSLGFKEICMFYEYNYVLSSNEIFI